MIAHAALDAVSEAVVVVDTATWCIAQANAPATVIFDLDVGNTGATRFEHIRLHLRGCDGEIPSAASLMQPNLQACEYRLVRHHKDTLSFDLRVSKVSVESGQLLVLVFRDLSERVHAASELRAASSRCGITFSQAATGLAHVSLDCTWSKVNLRLLDITGYEEAELLGMSVSEVTHPDDISNETLAYRQLLLGELPYYTREKRYVRKDGQSIWVSVTTSVARNSAGRPQYFIGMVEDISERKQIEERVQYMATHDGMTGLPNRHGLQIHLEKILQDARRNRRQVGVVFVDMDKLKRINDTLGHEQGDLALKEFSRQLRAQMRSGDMVARIGGDEFLIVFDNVTVRTDMTAILDRILLSMSEAGAKAGDATAPSCSIGISVFPTDGEDARTLMRNADQAMYRAKQDGGGRYAFFSESPMSTSSAQSPNHSFGSRI
ncbi:MAG: diguanylate cyclase [Pseudomonadota bacterium]|nr:diguanylate cyclase [Pseudomonadota bacterium]